MKTLGLIGGMSWESTALYYRALNVEVARRLGARHSSKLLLHSVDFEPVVRRQHAGDLETLGRELADVAGRLEGAGADAIVLCTNTMHAVAPSIQRAIGVPLLHIADSVGEALRDDGHEVVGLLGTRFTMEAPFYRERLATRFGLRVCTPDDADRNDVHRIIYDELCRGTVRDESRDRYRNVVNKLERAGATAIVLGCTEIGMLLPPGTLDVPTFDSLELHCRTAVEFQLMGTRRRTPTGQAG